MKPRTVFGPSFYFGDKMLTEHIIQSNRGTLFNGSYDAVIDWLYSHREYDLFNVKHLYTETDIPSKHLVVYAVRFRE